MLGLGGKEQWPPITVSFIIPKSKTQTWVATVATDLVEVGGADEQHPDILSSYKEFFNPVNPIETGGGSNLCPTNEKFHFFFNRKTL